MSLKKLLLVPVLSAAAFHLPAQADSSRTDSLTKARVAEMERLIPVFKAKKPSEDSAFVVNYSDGHIFLTVNFFPGNCPAGSGFEQFENAKSGDVLGPFVQNNHAYLYKVRGRSYSADSARVRHILIAYRYAQQADPSVRRKKWEAKALADSLCNVISSGKTPMTDLVLGFTDDPGSRSGNLGDYGWFDRESGFVQPFKDAGFNNPVGSTMVVETEFGYHVIQVVGRKRPQLCIAAIPFDRVIDWTIQDQVYPGKGYQPAAFPGGKAALRQFLRDSLRYPATEKMQGKEGVVRVVCQVTPDGHIGQVSASEVPGAPGFRKEAMRLVYSIPRWQPAMSGGKPMFGYATMQVVFVLNDY